VEKEAKSSASAKFPKITSIPQSVSELFAYGEKGELALESLVNKFPYFKRKR
jgi:hypothetical protein